MKLGFDPLYQKYTSKRYPVYARNGMVNCSSPLAAAAGLEILQRAATRWTQRLDSGHRSRGAQSLVGNKQTIRKPLFIRGACNCCALRAGRISLCSLSVTDLEKLF